MVGGYRGRSPREREPGKRGRVEPWWHVNVSTMGRN